MVHLQRTKFWISFVSRFRPDSMVWNCCQMFFFFKFELLIVNLWKCIVRIISTSMNGCCYLCEWDVVHVVVSQFVYGVEDGEHDVSGVPWTHGGWGGQHGHHALQQAGGSGRRGRVGPKKGAQQGLQKTKHSIYKSTSTFWKQYCRFLKMRLNLTNKCEINMVSQPLFSQIGYVTIYYHARTSSNELDVLRYTIPMCWSTEE